MKSRSSSKKNTRRPLAVQMGHRLREGLLLISIAVAVFLLIAFITYHVSDPGWSSTGAGGKIANWGGRFGALMADIFLSLFGYMSYALPPLFIFLAVLGVLDREGEYQFTDLWLKGLGFLFVMLSGSALSSIYLTFASMHLPASAGGMMGDVISGQALHFLNTTGSALFLFTTLLCGITLLTGLSWLGVVDAVGWQTAHLLNLFKRSDEDEEEEDEDDDEEEEKASTKKKKPAKVAAKEEVISPKPVKKLTITPVEIAEGGISKHLAKKLESRRSEVPTSITPGTVPPVSLLNPPIPSQGKAFSNVTFEELSLLVEQRLLDFGVEVKVVAVHPGPVVTRFELDLAPGIKVSKITGLAKDIARSLSATSVRVVEVIPGKSVIGLELPNEFREVVGLRDILESQRYQQSKSPLSLAIGKDISGYPVVVDLAKMPHLLAAGTTGSGKSVSINAMILSLLFKATPEQLRLILIDPKMLELSVYEGIPHLLTPVITDMKDAANALRWCVGEMDRRYRLMSYLGVRNLAGYNQKIADGIKQGNPITAPNWMVDANGNIPQLEALPMIVVVADELADMMMAVGKKVEDLITRIAQKARAAGIHLILATQRPSVDVITGLIKANIPTRIAFQVSSRVDSRTILDQQGAEQLLGNGDLLYLAPGTGLPVRVHGAFVADEEVHRVVSAWHSYGKPVYLEEVTEGPENHEEGSGEEGGEGGERDPLYDQAIKVVTEARRASISLVQRKLRIGYNRAARIMEDMESAGVVSGMDGNGAREVLAPPPVEA